MKLSFLLPTNRTAGYAIRVIKSICDIHPNKGDYEICIYADWQIIDDITKDIKFNVDNIKYFVESETKGPIYGFNFLFHNSAGKYIVCLVDDHEIVSNIFKCIECLESPTFHHRNYKIATLCPGVNNFANVPVKGDTWCGGIEEQYNCTPFNTMRFPIVSRDTVINKFGGYIFHPAFTYHAADLWLGYYLGMNNEPGYQFENININEYINLRNLQYEQQDCRIYHHLVNKHRNGYLSYV